MTYCKINDSNNPTHKTLKGYKTSEIILYDNIFLCDAVPSYVLAARVKYKVKQNFPYNISHILRTYVNYANFIVKHHEKSTNLRKSIPVSHRNDRNLTVFTIYIIFSVSSDLTTATLLLIRHNWHLRGTQGGFPNYSKSPQQNKNQPIEDKGK